MSTPTVPWLDRATCTHRGDRDSNEDRALSAAGGRLCAIADGMGGTAAGGVASQIAVEAVGMSCQELVGHTDEDERVRDMADLCERTNQLILQTSRRKPEWLGMGTTLTMAVLSPQSLSFAHAGDTRLYRWRTGTLDQLTEDHTSAQRTAGSAAGNALVKFLGSARQVKPHLGTCDLLPADRIMVSSDGVHDPLGDHRICEMLSLDLPATQLAECLVDAARSECPGTADNLTSIVVKIR